jgi:hypothetical protein
MVKRLKSLSTEVNTILIIVPSEPQSLQILNVGSNNFTIQWSEPVKIPGIMVNYQLFVNNSGPMHTPGAECLNTTSYNFTVDAQDTSYFFDKALPYYKYTVSLYAVDEAGEGNSTSNETITQSTGESILFIFNLLLTVDCCRARTSSERTSRTADLFRR